MASAGFVLKTPKNEKQLKSVRIAEESKKTGAFAAASDSRAAPPVASNANGADDAKIISRWTKERIWTEAIERETKSVKEWQAKFSFLAEYDQRGNKKEPRKLPDRVNMYSDTLPMSNGHLYGFGLETQEGKQIVSIEKALSPNHKKKRNVALICYD